MSDLPTEEQIRKFTLMGDKSAISDAQLKAMAYDYMNKVIRGLGAFPRWSPEIREYMNSLGVVQNVETGEPEFNGEIPKLWAARARIAEARMTSMEKEIAELLLIVQSKPL